MKSALLIAGVALTMALAASADPEGYPGAGAYRLVFEGDKCLRLDNRDDPWYRPCVFDDPLDFDALWRDEQVGDYVFIRNVRSNQCITQDVPMKMKDCNKDDGTHLWRYLHKDDYPADEVKVISKASDDTDDGSFECFVSDRNFGYENHAVVRTCNGGERSQFFKKAPAPATLPRY
ncbi:hypothetical protein SYNPS1DRAFT_28301 [Syncephalis pseudoplumigaleata]|uniref:Ricin B lectin domain-containing protein n=1 Tax=Syncephalis pseudoplumigaleata TaxID=1712513 RepID=A0A4P9Z0Q8_9FUNG|nr:hypothetical protein SYNPS1DRAFT_28301 [Syncephalis pseudoplumigaleata]|eukprot:RKP25984.1 hypothetical protein SYNPS1DRAFT_28301 [Syncephalis pseudoplumigaleata]